jgi:hypothetical protein
MEEVVETITSQDRSITPLGIALAIRDLAVNRQVTHNHAPPSQNPVLPSIISEQLVIQDKT